MNEQVHKIIPGINRKQWRHIALICVFGVSASAVMHIVTAQGPGVSPDSTVYIEAARTLLDGKGLFVDGQPLTHYPPVFPLLLALVGTFTGGDVLWAAHLLSTFFFGVNLCLAALAVYMCTGHDVPATSCVSLLVLLSAPAISTHAMVWSEAPYIAFSMAGLILLSRHIVLPNTHYLVCASLLIGLSAATRYVGIILFPTVVLALFVLSHEPRINKVRDTLLFLLLACPPLLFWLVRNMFIARSMANREVVFHLLSFRHVAEFITQMHDYFLPLSIPGWIKAVNVGGAATFFVLSSWFVYRRLNTGKNTHSFSIILPSVLLIFSVLYVAFLFLSISFLDANTPVDERLLLPVFFALIIICTSVAKKLSEVRSQKWIWHGYIIFLVFSVSINVVPALSEANSIFKKGMGYTAQYWRESETLALLQPVRKNMVIFSNAPDAIRFHTAKVAKSIPIKTDKHTLIENLDYENQMSHVVQECENGNALMVYFNRAGWRWYLPTKQEIDSLFSEALSVVTEDGGIYGRSAAQIKGRQNRE